MINLAKEVVYLPLDAVRPNPNQPRRIFDQDGLDELALSIQSYGILQPISVRVARNGTYELIAGERRLRASRIAGLTSVPAILVETSDEDSAVLAILENLQRRDLHFFEEAEGFRNLMQDHGFTQDELALRVGKKQSTVANKLRLLKLSLPVQRMLLEHELTERHARALLRLASEVHQLGVLAKVISQGLNVQKTEDLIQQLINPPQPKVRMLPNKLLLRDIRIFTNSVKSDLEVMSLSGLDSAMEVRETDTGYSINITLTRRQALTLANQHA